ncbi:hypothetical protein ALC62_00190 [Cyphomyrmex costatus]|uniref:Uncharacterized protein n=2 Tax=Cyphomyrmex costatus TaxID=456900 RepID=A0A151K263_9HYME|nr:hypothetical protein ALC62_00190 [Cyphomyrmex costatus]
MWIYGIRLFLTDSTKEAKSSAFNYDIIQTFLSNASNGKMSQESEMAKRIFDDKQESMRKYREKLLETFASGSKYDEYINKIGRSDNKKRLSNCGDNYEQLNATECKNIIERRNSKTEYSNCEENYERSNADVNNDNKTESIKETKSGIVNDKDFIQTFLSNTFLGKMSQPDLTRMFEFYDNHDNNEILNNEQFNQKMLETLPSDSEYFEWKNKIAKKDTGKERRNCEANHEQLDSFKCKNKNVRRNSDKDCTSQEDKKSETDIRIYIDNKFHDMEKRLMERIDEMEASTNRKLNAILERLESRVNVQ